MTFIIMAEGSNLLNSDAQCLVNPVNCVGVAGAGLALQFRSRWPVQVNEYSEFCRQGRMAPGILHDALLPDGRRILSIPTKRHWRDRSTLEDVTLGLIALHGYCTETLPASIALPALGCGLGGLAREDVSVLVKRYLRNLPIEFHLYGLTVEEG
jgi:O-acetyl-ADP-ribose deacetylase (regulator of RNase III)